MKFSPLFWPVQLKNKTILVLDETRLPEKTVYLKVRNYRQACAVIRQMKTRAVGQVTLVFYTFLLELARNKDKAKTAALLNTVAAALNSTRPTLSFRYLTDIVLELHRSGAPLEESINGFLQALKSSRIAQAEETAGLLKDQDVVLTHCNLSGLLPLVADIASRDGKRVSFFVTETRPYLQGMRLTAWELGRAGYSATIIADNMVAQVMSEGKINKVIVGADHLAKNGDIANKIGTFQIAILARHFKIPFFVICPPPSNSRTGRDITIEIRPEKELLEFRGIKCAPRGACGYYPAFDVTPAKLITRHIHLPIKK